MVRPGEKAAQCFSQWNAGEDEQRSNQRSGPATAKVSELGDGLGEYQLIGVALKVAQNRGAEGRGHDDGAIEAEYEVEHLCHMRSIGQHLSRTDEEVRRRNEQRGQRQPKRKEAVSGDVTQSKLDLEKQKIQKHGRPPDARIVVRGLLDAIRVEGKKIDIFQGGFHLPEAVAGRGLGVD